MTFTTAAIRVYFYFYLLSNPLIGKNFRLLQTPAMATWKAPRSRVPDECPSLKALLPCCLSHRGMLSALRPSNYLLVIFKSQIKPLLDPRRGVYYGYQTYGYGGRKHDLRCGPYITRRYRWISVNTSPLIAQTSHQSVYLSLPMQHYSIELSLHRTNLPWSTLSSYSLPLPLRHFQLLPLLNVTPLLRLQLARLI